MNCTRCMALAVVLALPLGAGVALAEDDPHAACAAAPDSIPPELLQRPVGLRAGVGNSREKVTTSSPQAQAFYEQGLNYLESYVWIEAARSFRQALRHDSTLAMAHLGLSRTSSGLDDPASAKASLARAKALGSRASDRERRRIQIRELQLAAIDDLENAERFLAYKKAIDDALALDFDDPQLWLLRGNAEEPNASGRGQRGTASSVAYYEAVLARVPDHASAHHYLVHTYETIGQIDKALAHGAHYARLSPAIPHAAHMWGHDLRRVGRVDDAIAQFMRTDSLERAYYAAEKLEPGWDWHHSHNLDLLASCYEHKGQMHRAEQIMRESGALATVSAYSAFNRRELPNFLIHRERYDDALREARAMTTNMHPQARAVGHALAGQALLGLGRAPEAQKELDAARKELASVPKVAAGLIPRRAQVEPWVEAAHGELLLRTGKKQEGSEILRNSVRALRAMTGPDAWSQGLFRLESMARTAREAGDWDLAGFIADQMLEHDGAYGGSHLARALVLRHKGDQAGFRRESEIARAMWRDADPDLAELTQLGASATPKR